MEDRRKNDSVQRALILTFVSCCLETLFCTFLLLRIPSDSKNAFLLGLSKERLLMLAAFGVLLLGGFIGLLCKQYLYETILTKPAAGKCFRAAAAVSLFAILLPDYRFHRSAAIYSRLKPFLIWIFLTTLTFALFCTFDRDRFTGFRETWRNLRREKRWILSVLAVLLFGIAFTELTGLGKTAETALWNKNGIPLQSIQLYGSILIFVLLQKLGVIGFFSRRKHLTNFLLIWALSALIWSLAPLSGHFFAPGPYEPDLQYYPYSDAVMYDISAQTALNGWGFNLGRTVLKPTVAYISFLTHLVTGNNSNLSMLVQSALYAVLPAIIYLFGSALGGTGCGFLAAAFSLLKEWNALNSHSVLTVHSRLVMSEFLTQILLAALAYAVFCWLKKNGRESLYAAIAGGSLTLGMYTRYNFMAFLPASLLILLIGYRRELRRLIKPLFVFFLTVFLTAAPMLIRDTIQTGGAFSELAYTVKEILIARRFKDGEAAAVQTEVPVIPEAENTVPTSAPELVIPLTVSDEKTESPAESGESSALPLNPEEKINTGQITQEFSNNSSIIFPAVFKSMINHGLHNFIASALTLPMEITFQDLEHLYTQGEGGLWADNWEGRFTPGQWCLILIWVTAAAAACGMLLKVHGIAGFSILYFWLVYCFSIGFSRSSGGRYIVPCSWIPMLLLAYGILLLESRGSLKTGKETAAASGKGQTVLTIICFTAFFTSMVLFEKLMPSRAANIRRGDLEAFKQQLADLPEADWNEVEKQVSEKTMSLTSGVVLYPRYYYYMKGEHTQTGALVEKDYSRMTFTGINREGGSRLMQEYLLPHQELITVFPQGSDFRALSCKNALGYEDILAVMVETAEGDIYTYVRDPLAEFSCPVPEPVCTEIGKCR